MKSAEVEGAYAVVTADCVRELFAYVSVIDTQDLIFVRGMDGAGAPGSP